MWNCLSRSMVWICTFLPSVDDVESALLILMRVANVTAGCGCKGVLQTRIF